jgi:glycerol-3-phosphate dehydrogenase (NAD(P)+)
VHLAGPAIANELARGVPASVVLASTDDASARRVAAWLDGPFFLPDTTTDVTGAALGGILKNVHAILLGALETLGGDARNLEAAFLAAAVREMAAIARAHGGESATIHGLAGLGDLVATGFSRDSHNRGLGRRLAAGQTAAALEREQGWLPEGARATATVCALARSGGVAAPLAGWVRRTLAGSRPTLDGLMRALRAANRTARENSAAP